MSTRSLIGIQNANGSIDFIYCHHDGYLSYVGKKLVNHYRDEETIRKLLNLGDMSSLGDTPVSDVDGWKVLADTTDALCTTYKSRGETGVDFKTAADREEYFQRMDDYGVDYIYVYVPSEQRWLYRDGRVNKPWRSVAQDL